MPGQIANIPIVAVPDNFKLGPAMAKLTENQRNYVWALVHNGGDEKRAAAAAGYGGTENSRAQAISNLRHNPRVIEAIKEMSIAEIGASVFLATAALRDIVADPSHKDRLKAIDILLSRGGINAVQEIKVTHEHKDQTTDAVIARIKALAKEMNVDPTPLLASAGVHVTDAEFTEVTPVSPETISSTDADQEDDEWTVRPT